MLLALAIPVVAQNAPQIFPDVGSNAYFSSAVQDLSRIGIVRGYDNGNFGPGDYVTRGQVAVMIQRYDQTVVDPLRQQLEAIRQKLNLGQCGDGTVQTGEQCDDGTKNGTPGDQCTVNCLKVSTQNSCGGGHQIGDTYPSPDGCNTCSCTPNGSVCTLRACAPQPTKCTSSSDCPSDQICSTEMGDCQSACPPGAQSCIQVCTGVCRPRAASSSSSGFDCKPYVCADGAVIASCTSDGHVINYFADPCMTHGGHLSSSSSSSMQPPSICGNGICEPNESPVGCDPAGPNDHSCDNRIFCPQDCAR